MTTAYSWRQQQLWFNPKQQTPHFGLIDRWSSVTVKYNWNDRIKKVVQKQIDAQEVQYLEAETWSRLNRKQTRTDKKYIYLCEMTLESAHSELWKIGKRGRCESRLNTRVAQKKHLVLSFYLCWLIWDKVRTNKKRIQSKSNSSPKTVVSYPGQSRSIQIILEWRRNSCSG